jgi:TatD DNase family protein
MFSDTHCHLQTLAEEGTDTSTLLRELGERGCPFLLDIGTKAGDVPGRYCPAPPDFLFFSAGIWPSPEAIGDCERQVTLLAASIAATPPRIVAIGECGIDRRANPRPGEGERRLFEAQMALAQSLNLPVIVHSRDAFDDTLACIKNSGVTRGVIHCFSYSIPEARAFLDLGWHISFSGTITYVKKSTYEATAALLRSIPRERFLLETDAPYLAPVPYRGKSNTPLLIEHTYRFAADMLSTSVEALAALVLKNARELFGVAAD